MLKDRVSKLISKYPIHNGSAITEIELNGLRELNIDQVLELEQAGEQRNQNREGISNTYIKACR